LSPSPVRATAATTIRGVSILTGRRRSPAEVFDIALSTNGIEIRWPGQAATRMPWNRVSQWEIEERRGGVLLTLRGGGATTPLVVPGWSLDDLEAVMRTTAGTAPATPRTPATPAMPALSWKVIATVVLLGLLATAVTLVLLQSAGVISWGFLGPTA
jgi:hypothetical protein